MSSYTGILCPVCGRVFADGDDVVVCPDCGTPHHRECYNRLGHCISADSHGPDFSWQPENAGNSEQPADAIVCSRCGSLNDPSANQCELCGYPLPPAERRETPHPAEEAPRQNGERGVTYAQFVSEQRTQVAKRFGVDNPAAAFTDDITIGELSDFIGPNNLSFIVKFRSMMMRSGISFNICAFFFTGFYCFYRKMYKLGAAAVTVLAAIYAYYLYNVMPYMMEYLSTGVMPESGEAYETATAVVSIVQGVSFITSMLLGFFFNRLYMSHCISSIRALKANDNIQYTTGCTGGYRYCLARKGGVDRITVIVVVALMFMAYLLYTYFLMNGNMPS